ncbi:type II toxin-antitoxin system VapC family toxin [Runella salmonicolor]|uniref:Type II toxin-antitoxin system VapC family toxin n=1 Tax=Runella salmonicolor TaxID=2950278 RepID=A0ABT1FKA2_9BACT|nr:type II toxin-antitoxin system VapC family toxin [Runella salmonicolor]MCP1382210.1 type II toxin-antitoxin system VapC family toxin [Runella salmonicolor]
MKNIVIDTCVFIHIIRDTITGKKCLDKIEKYDTAANVIISVVTKAELESFIAQNNWGKPKIEKLNKILEAITYIDISNADQLLLESYTEIDSFSKRKTKDKNGNLLKGSAKKMGKNDLWIAATAYSLDIPLMTTDSDFDHLNETLMEVIKIV